MFKTAEREAFATLKDHKPNFNLDPKCRLLNPTKPEIGRVSKIILDRINKKIRDLSKHQQWVCTDNVIEWFKGLGNKNKLHFLQFDIESFYPSISENAVNNALLFAKDFCDISDEECNMGKKEQS